MRKKVLISLLEPEVAFGKKLAEELARSGLDVQGHVWSSDFQSMAWSAAAKELASCSLWLITGRSWEKAEVRKSLALAALAAQAVHGNTFPILLSPSTASPDMASLPTPLLGAELVTGGKVGVKCAIRATSPRKGAAPDYRITPLAPTGLGLWFEIGPQADPWKGAFFACGAKENTRAVPVAHGVGMAGTIPEKCTLNSPVKGMKLQVHDIDCEGWGVQNSLTVQNSYYLKLGDVPDILVFGAFPDSDDVDMNVISLL